MSKTENNNTNNTNKKNDIIYGALIIGICIASAILTIYIDQEDDDKSSTDTSISTEFTTNNTSDISSTNKPVLLNNSSEEKKDPYKELNELIGLDSVKSQVNTLSNFIRINIERAAAGNKTPNISYHCVFTGNPGTGKTTVARIMAGIYKDLGVVSKGHLVETDRSGLIAEYVGQTATKTNAIIDSAIGGVLFIDEAYALVQGGDDYGPEAIATLLKRMEDDRKNLVVIVAGYSDEMKDFINSNPGLKSRFNNYINFPDYNANELTQIFITYVNKYNYKLTPDAQEYVLAHMKSKIAQHDRNFGNARYARNLFEKAIQIQANRLAKQSDRKKEDLSILTKEDITNAKIDKIK